MRPVDYSLLTEKRCSRCGQTKPVSEFNKYTDAAAPINGWRYYSRCIECSKEGCREYGAKTRNRRNERLRNWRKKNPDKARAGNRRKILRYKYGITEQDYDNMACRQGHKCILCGREMKLVVDHCHKTGRVRGLLCNRCNTTLGWVESRPDMLEKIVHYLVPSADCHADVLLEIANEGVESHAE